jgi:hypothetical protein
VLFMRPKEHEGYVETVNDYDGYVANFWRAVQAAPEEVAYVVIQSGRMKDVIL